VRGFDYFNFGEFEKIAVVTIEVTLKLIFANG